MVTVGRRTFTHQYRSWLRRNSPLVWPPLPGGKVKIYLQLPEGTLQDASQVTCDFQDRSFHLQAVRIRMIIADLYRFKTQATSDLIVGAHCFQTYSQKSICIYTYKNRYIFVTHTHTYIYIYIHVRLIRMLILGGQVACGNAWASEPRKSPPTTRPCCDFWRILRLKTQTHTHTYIYIYIYFFGWCFFIFLLARPWQWDNDPTCLTCLALVETSIVGLS